MLFSTTGRPMYQNEVKYIVYHRNLMELFTSCSACYSPCDVQLHTIGTFVSIHQTCPHCEQSRSWSSQPFINGMAAGNLQLSAAVFFSGASFSKIQRVLQVVGLQSIGSLYSDLLRVSVL